ncbi:MULTISPECIES: hypothetical protein [Pyrobaculum]|uniref:Uncharacterized protein n=2 Tax=Pyrobaculum arsenaticum TaxID=121277 RepID=A4WLU6_PYRAR|nr:hypothetical protein [Pyrobaculum arsenaticum]ABP51363.1 conserved hypothetical protein [Pyrobaculum arsenaticum DSM 13514]MCY0889408.1 hypothetical protein [Pyrobaculum arsenaticum]NYR16267.1 hypothetical protein [Pyrobaculum arsenaticum]
MDILLEEVRRAFGNTAESKLAESLIQAYREGGPRGVRRALLEYLKALGVDVEDRED